MELDMIPEGHNLCAYYMLPLLDVNVNTYPGFVNAYLSYNGKVIMELDNHPDTPYWLHASYVTDFNQDGHTFIVYRMPHKFEEAVGLFLDGRYSEFPADVKKVIYQGSGLPFNKAQGSTFITHNVLLVLAKHATLKKYLEDELGVQVPASGELWTKPNLDKEILDIDTDICYDK
jgi:hypothetical protein